MKKSTNLLIFLTALVLSGFNNSYNGDKIFFEYKVRDFEFKGRNAKIVFPDKANHDKTWIWRARFWGHEPQVDKELLDRGFHVVYIDVAGLFGNKEAVNIWNEYYDFLMEEYQLNTKVVLEGMSRGGLIIYNWASQNIDKVACIYADAPVCDIKSWPGGLYNGKGSPFDWEKCLKAYDLDESSVMNFANIPAINAKNVAKANIPVIHVCGAADKVVPYDENTKVLASNFEHAGGTIEIILKEGVGHHPHSLKDPKPIVDFILKNTLDN